MTNQDDVRATGRRLWRAWTDMWNRSPEIAEAIVGDSFTLHATTPVAGIESIRDGRAVRAWVTAFRAPFAKLVFQIAEPFVDIERQIAVGPWIGEAELLAGGGRRTCGIDLLRFEGPRIVEVWTTSKETTDEDTIARWRNRDTAPADR